MAAGAGSQAVGHGSPAVEAELPHSAVAGAFAVVEDSAAAAAVAVVGAARILC
jgi:hypothetical protein